MTKTYRCEWCGTDETYIAYHDEVWGVPVHDDQTHFEFLILEGAQAGLSWITILKRRDGYRKAFHQFDPEKVARMTEKDIERLRNTPDIIRNHLKIQSAIRNAKAFLAVQKAFGSFDQYIWRYVDGKPIRNAFRNLKEIPSTTPLAQNISADLKKRGFNFVGPTIVYAYMQAIGMVNDHVTRCFRYREV